MLVLSRSKSERIILTLPDGSTVAIIVASINGNRVKLGIEAPKEVKIIREELDK